MKAFIVLAHPEPKSFSSSMFRAARDVLLDSGHQVEYSDLYAMRFNPVSDRGNFISIKDPDYFKQQAEEMHAAEVGGFAPDIEREMQKLESCDLMIWQFPLWWFGLPAILKGWVDRVFAMGRIYGTGRIYDNGAFRGKRAMLSLTTGGPEESYSKDGFNGDIHAIIRPIHRGMFKFVGFDVLAPNIVFGPAHLTDEERKERLSAYKTRLGNIFEETPISIGSY